jgi:predicted RNA-binding protein YlxR (DUF448 family)
MRAKPASPREGKRKPVRTCVACRREGGKAELVRLVRRPDGSVQLDRTGKVSGRGAYIHPTTACVEAARKRRALDRALGAPVPPELWAQVSNSPGPA